MLKMPLNTRIMPGEPIRTCLTSLQDWLGRGEARERPAWHLAGQSQDYQRYDWLFQPLTETRGEDGLLPGMTSISTYLSKEDSKALPRTCAIRRSQGLALGSQCSVPQHSQASLESSWLRVTRSILGPPCTDRSLAPLENSSHGNEPTCPQILESICWPAHVSSSLRGISSVHASCLQCAVDFRGRGRL